MGGREAPPHKLRRTRKLAPEDSIDIYEEVARP